MYNISSTGNTILITNGNKQWGFPPKSIWLHANEEDGSSIDVKLGASRKLMLSFNYKDCNLAGNTPYETLQNIMQIL